MVDVSHNGDDRWSGQQTGGLVCFLGALFIGFTEPVAFTGDTLFNNGVGRTDFEYGNEEALLNSIKKKLLTLPDDTIIYPGHGELSTIGDEKRGNPFLS